MQDSPHTHENRLLLYRGDEFDPNFFYHAGVDIDNCFLVIENFQNKKPKKTLFTSKMNEELARETFEAEGRGKVLVYEKGLKILERSVKEKKHLADFSSLTALMAARLSKMCKITDASEKLAEMRSVKGLDEVERIRKATGFAHDILDSLDFNVAKTELDLKSQILAKTFERDVTPAFEPIVSTDANTRFPHYSGGPKKLGKLVMVDMGVKYEHYRSDLTRMFFLERDTKLETRYEEISHICHSTIDEIPNASTGYELAEVAEKLLKRAGFPPLIHSLGHGIGLDVHEKPRINLRFKEKFAAGMTMAIEPGFYLSRYGMRHEETVYFDGKKARIL